MRFFGADHPLAGVGFRFEVSGWTLENADDFEVFELTIDHYFAGNEARRNLVRDLASEIPIAPHGIGLSLGTAAPPNRDYLDQVASVLDVLSAPWYSEHLAFTKDKQHDLAQLLPLPRTNAVADIVISNINVVKQHIDVPLVLENITYYFSYPQNNLDELEFLSLICRETDSFVLLDIENLYLNSVNHGYDPFQFIDRLPTDIVRHVHLAGGEPTRVDDKLYVDTHSHPIPNDAFRLLEHLLRVQSPDSIILERDNRFDSYNEVLPDVRRIRDIVGDTSGCTQ